MSKAVVVLVLMIAMRGCEASPAVAEDVKPPEPPPALAASQQIALKAIDDDENDLKQKWQIDEAKKAAVMAEFSKEHAGWYLGPNNTPTKVTTPAPEKK